MDALNEILDQLLTEKPREPMSQAERNARSVAMSALFASKDKLDRTDAAKRYLDETAEIPFSMLVLAIKGLIRAHPYPDVPAVADLWSAARRVAGMHRQQHRAGQYLPPNKQWPPEGKRHAICYGAFDPIQVASVTLLNDPKRAPRYLGSGQS